MTIRFFYLDPGPKACVKFYYQEEGSDVIHYLGRLKKDLSMPPELLEKILKTKQQAESLNCPVGAIADKHKASDVYDSRGRVRALRIYSGQWHLTIYGTTIRKKVEATTLKSDVVYFATRIALSLDMDLDSIAFIILVATITNMTKTY